MDSWKIDELNNSYNKKEEELLNYKKLSSIQIWKNELDEFIKVYNNWYHEYDNNQLKNTKKNKTKKIKK